VRFEHVDRGKSVTIESRWKRERRLDHSAQHDAGNTIVLRELPAAGTVFNMKFRGNTLVELTPPLAPVRGCINGARAIQRERSADERGHEVCDTFPIALVGRS